MNVALHGYSGSGKSTVAQLLRDLGYQHAETGKACREICRELFGTESKTVLNATTDALRAIDEGVWIRAALRAVDPNSPVVLDSMRFRYDWNYLKSRGYCLVHIEAETPVRMGRLLERGQVFDPALDSLHVTENELADARFDFTLNNNGSIADLQAELAPILPRLGIS